jgi:hypothetical protein
MAGRWPRQPTCASHGGGNASDAAISKHPRPPGKPDALRARGKEAGDYGEGDGEKVAQRGERHEGAAAS